MDEAFSLQKLLGIGTIMKEKTTCYMCESPATTKEHVPPRSFFPPGFRKDLITVPSCNIHNTKKSNDDEYLRSLITIQYEVNTQARNLFSEKVMKALQRRPNLLRSFFFSGKTYPIFVDGEPSLAITYDYERVIKALTCIAKAVHFYHFGTKWDEKLWVLPVSATFPPEQENVEIQNARLTELKTGTFETPKFGKNPEIFYYQFLNNEDNVIKRLRMGFFEGFIVYAVSRSIVDHDA